MKTKQSYEKVVVMFVKLLLLLVLSPLFFTLALKGYKIYTSGLAKYLTYAALAISVILILYTVYHGFRTLQKFVNTLFENKD